MRHPLSWALALATALALLIGATAVVHADDGATRAAKKHYEKGEKLFALGRFEDALAEYEAAFEAKPLPGFLFNIGQCHRNLGDYEAAIFSYRKYLKLEPDADNREAVEELIADLEQKIEARKERPLPDPDPPPPDDRKTAGKPIYKKWWFWGGVAAVAGAGTGTYLILSEGGLPDSDLGNVVFK
jgi:tetratricopeptide (TPR) repeat protein